MYQSFMNWIISDSLWKQYSMSFEITEGMPIVFIHLDAE